MEEVEREYNGKLAFLETEIVHKSNGSLIITVCRKITNTDKYRLPSSITTQNCCCQNTLQQSRKDL